MKRRLVYLSALCLCLPAHSAEAVRGLAGEYFEGESFAKAKGTHVDPTIDFPDTRKLAAERTGREESFSVHWKGQVKADLDGTYTFHTLSEGGVRLWVNEVLLVDNWRRHGKTEDTGTLILKAGRWYSIQLDYFQHRRHGAIQLFYSAKGLARTVIPASHLRPVGDLRESYPDPYARPPDFLQKVVEDLRDKERREYDKKMDLSFEPTFYTLTDLHGYSKPEPRSTALVRAALEKEQQGEYREALEVYQKVIDQHDDDLYRISKFGIFVPVSQYCQRRILRFPPGDLAFYRTKHDGRAREAFEQTWRTHSLEGLAEIVDNLLATSYGGKAMLALGDAALDRGHHLEALEYYATVWRAFPDAALRTPELELKIAYCRKMLGEKAAAGAQGPRRAPRKGPANGKLSPEQRALLERVFESTRYEKPPFHSQRASGPHVACDDYSLCPPTNDPLALAEPVWNHALPGARHDFFVYTQPTVTTNSVVYRHKNIVYCRSILTGELRWRNDLGGRVTWQVWQERQYPQEDVLVQDGLVFTPMYKVGPTLVALDETTGQLKWAYGPMVAATREQAQMRFEAAPAGGPRTVYAGYVADDIEGDTHIDTEYGVIAFESTTGRIRWRRPLCRLRPGEFAAQMAERRRNRIRSFTSPPLYHQGTVYYCTNAGAVAALHALSGRVKWVMRYPYYALPYSVHDATRPFGRADVVQYTRILARPHRPMFWYNQRPLLLGEKLFVLPVDSRFMFSIDRRTGQVRWSRRKLTKNRFEPYNRISHEDTDGGTAYLLGQDRAGHLVAVYSGRGSQVHLVDPETGKTVWASPDLVARDPSPIMHYWAPGTKYGEHTSLAINGAWYETAARPLLTADGRVYATSFTYKGWPIFGWASNLCALDLAERKVLARRHYYNGAILAYVHRAISIHCPNAVKVLEELPHKDEKTTDRLAKLKKMAADHVPVNPRPPFLPFSRLTFDRYGVRFELRTGPRSIAMVYGRDAVRRALAGRADPEGLFARAELAVGDSRLAEAAARMKQCLAAVSSEDVDLRAAVNQQLFKVHKRLARSGIRAARTDQELANALGMSRTVSTLSDEIETLFALAEAYQRRGEPEAAARMLRSVVSTYAHYEHPIPSVLGAGRDRLLTTSQGVIDKGRGFVKATLYGQQLGRSLELMRQGLPLYFTTLSPLEKDLTVRAGDLAAARLVALQKSAAEFARAFEQTAKATLQGLSADEQLHRLWEFPGTAAGQAVLDELFRKAAAMKGQAARRTFWRLSDVARVCGLTVPQAYRAGVAAPPPADQPTPLNLPFTEREDQYQSQQELAWLVLERRGDRKVKPDLVFLGGRLKKRLDYYNFTLACVDANTGKLLWKGKQHWGGRRTDELRLRGKGNEPGFFEAFVHGALVVVHGLYDVLAFALADGTLRWRYRVPFDFEIKHAAMSGDLLVLSGKAETLALYVPADDPRGELVWQEKDEGDTYAPPYFHGDRWVSVRKLPFNATVRYRATGKLRGRLALPDLSLHAQHPLFDQGYAGLPVVHDGKLLVVSDGWYYIAVDVEQMKIVWKRLIDHNDPTREPALRFALAGDYLAVVKEDFDRKAIYMLSSRTGEVLWHTDPKVASPPQPMHSMLIVGDALYGIQIHPGQGFYFAGLHCNTGRPLFRRTEEKGYQGKPQVRLLPRLFGQHAVATVKDRQDFELKAFDVRNGKLLHRLKAKGVGNLGEHGRVSATIQNGKLFLLSKDKLKTALGQ